MIRVGFVLIDYDKDWLGGANYISNLLHAIEKVANRQIEPVLIVPPATSAKLLEKLPSWQVLRTVLVNRHHLSWYYGRKFTKRVLGRDFLLENFLRKNCIDVLSHSGSLGRNAKLPTIGWIPDFQHRRMPEFFQPKDVAERDQDYRRSSQQCDLLLLSSVDAQNDLADFNPDALDSSRVLHFVSGFAGSAPASIDETILRDRYEITGPYFHLPNQFWAHKNHRLVIDALALLKAQGSDALVICTGLTKDHRWPNYFQELMTYATAKGVTDSFRVLGRVPYEDLMGLMIHSVAIINPSLFEGWSTTVEEAKSLGLNIVLSDIPVHREQNPDRGTYFDPKSATDLADVLESVLKKSSGETGLCNIQLNEHLSKRFSKFGTKYQELVLELVSR